MAKRDSIFVNILHYASSSLFQKFLGVFTAFIRPKLLSPELFGLWNVLNILPSYASYLHLGSRSAMRFQVPYYESRGEEEKISAAKAAVYYGALFPTFLFSLILMLVALILDTDHETKIGLAAIAVIVILDWRYGFLLGALQSHQEFKLISRCKYLTAFVYFVLTAVLIFFFGFYGALLAAILTIIVGIIYLQRFGSFLVLGRFRFDVFRSLVKTGFPIVVFNLILDLIRSSDRLILFFFLGPETVGYYGIAIMVLGFSLSIPAVSREVVEPRLMENLDRATLAQNLELYMTRPLMNTAYLMPFVVGPGILLLPMVIKLLLPNYLPGVNAAQILLLGGYFLAISHALRGVIVAYGLQIRASLVELAILVLNVGLSITMVLLGYGAEGVALASGFSFFLMLIGLLTFIWWQMRDREHGLTTNYYWLFAPFPVMCTLLVIPDRLLTGLIGSPTLLLVVKMLLFIIFQGILLQYVRRRRLISFWIDSK